MNDLATIVVDSAVWAGWSACVAFVVSRRPPVSFEHDIWLTRARGIEHQGRAYERLRIRRWKDRLPEAGTWFGGRSKRHLAGPGRRDLEQFVADTRRAELVHWGILALTPAFALWNRPALLAAMVAYGLAANVPFIAIQRYNRARIERVLARRQRAHR